MITYTREEFFKAWGPEGLEKIKKALLTFSTQERKVDMLNNPGAALNCRDYVNIVNHGTTLYLCIEANWWFNVSDGRIKANIVSIEFFEDQKALDDAMKISAAKAIKLNQN
jgi:hypothetical protein